MSLHDSVILARAAAGKITVQIEWGEDTAVSDDAGNEVRRGHVECGIIALHALRRVRTPMACSVNSGSRISILTVSFVSWPISGAPVTNVGIPK